ncbi:amino acid ABC transporter ATP-binding protein [Lacticaseibacillus parakribbianus]|uniref:amino acid ABC transporter ATP-binding protein n=1 Tax=Lacticaseibacillus parakribbianus TaxID=2970927 RepID=UPI0021CB213D|nr:amino acid ABC transporter ATP-binding protein [Lacticaseibacillus parakribbianus]
MLTIENLNKDFGQGHGLKNVSVTFPEHQTTVIVGPSGSGKTTLLRHLDFLETADSGRYRFGDQDLDLSKPVTRQDVLAARRKLGIVFQSYNLFPHLSVLANIIEAPVHVLGQAKAAATATAERLLTQVGLADKAQAFPAQLSGGQQQRVAIARMIAMQPQYMLFDEPTSALDPELEVEVLKVIQQLAAAKNSLIIVTHNMAFAQGVADKIVFVEDGEIAYDGDPDQFFNHPNDRIAKFLAAGTFQAEK